MSIKKSLFHAPYDILLGDVGGRHLLEVTVYNTLANLLEGYRAPSGLTGGALIYRKE